MYMKEPAEDAPLDLSLTIHELGASHLRMWSSALRDLSRMGNQPCQKFRPESTMNSSLGFRIKHLEVRTL